MRKIAWIVFIAGILIFSSCNKKSPTETPPANTIHPQVDIPWPSLADSPWPMFHHDPQSTGRSQYVGPRKGKIKWTFKPNGTIYSAIVIGPDSVIYFPFNDGAEFLSGLYALYPNGKMKWKLQVPLESDTQPLITSDNTIFLVGLSSFKGGAKRCLYAINPDGTVKNKLVFDFEPYTCLNIGIDGTLYFNDESYLYAVSQQGNVLWRLAASHEFRSYNNALSPDGRTIYLFDYITTHQISSIYAVGPDGQLKWSFPVEGDQHATDSPLVDSEGFVYFGTFGISDSCGFYSLSPDGQLNWQYPGMFNGGATISNSGYTFFEIISSETKLISLDYLGDLRWQKENEVNLSPFICDNEVALYSCSSFGVNAFDSAGNLLWQVPFDTPSTRVACPAIGYDGTLYVGTFASPMNDSKLYAIE